MNLRWLALITQYAPLILAATPLAPIAPFVAIGIHSAEAMKGATKQEKLSHAVEITQASIVAVNAQVGHQVIDPTTANRALVSGISAVVDVVNMVHRHETANPIIPASVTE